MSCASSSRLPSPLPDPTLTLRRRTNRPRRASYAHRYTRAATKIVDVQAHAGYASEFERNVTLVRVVTDAGLDGWYCLTGSKWRNPFKIGVHGDRAQVIERYRRYLLDERPDLPEYLWELRGKTLYCFCAPPGGLTAADRPYVCHGQALCELADALPEEG